MRAIAISCLILPLAAATLSACQSRKPGELAYVERPVERLYSDAVAKLDEKNYTQAVLFFDEVERQHPYSEWARRATLMSAYASYKLRQYDKAIEASQGYISVNPAGEGAPYAYYLVAMSYFDQIVDVGRDQKTTELAQTALQDVARRFPNTDYARDATLKLDMVNDQLAGKEMDIGRWYLRRNEHLAAANRFANVVKNYQTTSHAPEALNRLVEVYISLGLNQEALAAGSVLGYNYPNSYWYKQSYRLLTSKGQNLDSIDETQRRSWLQKLIPGGK